MLLSVILYTLGASVAMWTVEGIHMPVPVTLVELANAAVKARLVEHLKTELKQSENTKKTMVTAVKECQILINQTLDLCKGCIKGKCLARANSCKAKVDIGTILNGLTSKGIKLLESAWDKSIDMPVDFANGVIDDVVGTVGDVVVEDIAGGIGDIVGDVAAGVPDIAGGALDIATDIGGSIGDWFSGFGRRRRSAEPSCQDLKDKGGKACMVYTSSCSSCQKLAAESGIVVLGNVCGSGAVTSYNNMIQADQKTKTLLAVYRLYIKLATLLPKLEVDTDSMDYMTGKFSKVYATVNVANVNSRYLSTAGFSYGDAAASGTAIGDEVWDRFWAQGVFGNFQKSTKKRAFISSKPSRLDKWDALTHKLQAMAEKGLL